MRITEQIDALDTMAINPLQYLIAPKLVAGLIGVPLLVAIFDVVGIYGGYLVGVELLGGNGGAYWNSIASAVGPPSDAPPVCVASLPKPMFSINATRGNTPSIPCRR